MKSNIKKAIVISALAVSIALIFWITLSSRSMGDVRQSYEPFWSYKEIINGNFKPLIEIIENIILFVPIGMAAGLILHLNFWQTLVMGFVFSLIIESCQWYGQLGHFEVDDLVHNTLGAVLGAAFVKIPIIGKLFKLPKKDRGKNAIVLAVLVALILLVGVGRDRLEVYKMTQYAAMNDKEDGTKNLLVLNSKPEYIGKTNFTVSYNSDGSVLFEGYSKEKAWIEIGRLTLPEGKYYFTGLSGVPDETVAIELEYYDKEQNKYLRLTKDVGAIDGVEFKLDEPTRVRALIRLSAGAEGKYIAHPAIYREE